MQLVQGDEPALNGLGRFVWAVFGNFLLERGAHVVARTEPHQDRHIGGGKRIIVVVHPFDEVELERGVRAEGAHDGHDGLFLTIDDELLPDGVFRTEALTGVFIRQHHALFIEMRAERRVTLNNIKRKDVEQRRVRDKRLALFRITVDIGSQNSVLALRLHLGPFIHRRDKATRGETQEIPAKYGADGVEVLVVGDGGVVRVVVAQPEGREREADEADGKTDDGDDALCLVTLKATDGNREVMCQKI